jgi:hypothetical protein
MIPLWLFSDFWNMITPIHLNVNMCLILMHSTLYKHLELMMPRYEYTIKIGHFSVSFGWMEIKLNKILRLYTTLIASPLY